MKDYARRNNSLKNITLSVRSKIFYGKPLFVVALLSVVVYKVPNVLLYENDNFSCESQKFLLKAPVNHHPLLFIILVAFVRPFP